ncbi:MAG: M23 family metallopeptidase [Zhengella sp.]|uniref:M23 family metallopeptidase n=1 Tax=Zhengella sp. TaxID=2282762 RepID=UPI001D3FF076|nr:M23 family metallopeptidase [Notoacmeibacter sp.]MCC0028615.1 M23 family metallopeptidase [Brucellaceae bacterium]
MQDTAGIVEALGNADPILAGDRRQPPDRREVSVRWLSGTFLTGLTSTLLMGVALSAALEGRQQLATPPEILVADEMAPEGGRAGESKTGRLALARPAPKANDRKRMEVSTMVRAGDSNVVRMVPFVEVSMALAAGHTTDRSYPKFDPLSVFSEKRIAAGDVATGTIYGAKVESEVTLRTVDFPLASAEYDERSGLSANEVEEVVRRTGAILTDGAVQVAALHYVDPTRFGETYPGLALSLPHNVKIVQENVSLAPPSMEDQSAVGYAEDVIVFRESGDLEAAFSRHGYDGTDAAGMGEAIATLMQGARMKAGTVLRIGLETRGENASIMRASVYAGDEHILTIARDDRGQYVPAEEPSGPFDAVAYLENSLPPVRSKADLPTVYDGIYRAALSYGLTGDMTKELIRLLAADVDYQARLNPSDTIDVFFSNPDENSRATEQSRMLYVKANFGGHARSFFRWRDEDGHVDYFDENGRSARQFLLRNPVPNGKFRSGFGMRRHPILGYSRMHTGADWAAPTGTPIIASGNGVVEKAGWAGGYGRQTIIRHANGYKTSYNHQSAFAKGIKTGARVRQGQIIGYIGSSGLSTGPHLHYELMVNGRKVDPMRVRLPTGKVLKGEELAAFQQERDRIEALLETGETGELEVASR